MSDTSNRGLAVRRLREILGDYQWQCLSELLGMEHPRTIKEKENMLIGLSHCRCPKSERIAAKRACVAHAKYFKVGYHQVL